MKFLKLNKITKDYFGLDDIARVLGITPAAARVFAHRYVNNKVFTFSDKNGNISAESKNLRLPISCRFLLIFPW